MIALFNFLFRPTQQFMYYAELSIQSSREGKSVYDTFNQRIRLLPLLQIPSLN